METPKEEIKAEIKPIEQKAEPSEFDGMNDTQKMQMFLEEHLKLQQRFGLTFDFQPQIRIVKFGKV